MLPALPCPCYAVIFTSIRLGASEEYDRTASRMLELVQKQPGFLGVESCQNADGKGVTISYWESLEAIAAWKANEEHREAQRRGRTEWYESFTTRIVKVERESQYVRGLSKP